MKPKTKRLLKLVIALAVVSPLSLLWTAIISITALETLLLDWDGFFDEEVR